MEGLTLLGLMRIQLTFGGILVNFAVSRIGPSDWFLLWEGNVLDSNGFGRHWSGLRE